MTHRPQHSSGSYRRLMATENKFHKTYTSATNPCIVLLLVTNFSPNRSFVSTPILPPLPSNPHRHYAALTSVVSSSAVPTSQDPSSLCPDPPKADLRRFRRCSILGSNPGGCRAQICAYPTRHKRSVGDKPPNKETGTKHTESRAFEQRAFSYQQVSNSVGETNSFNHE